MNEVTSLPELFRATIAALKLQCRGADSGTIDRWDDATGENLIEQIAAVGDLSGGGATPA